MKYRILEGDSIDKLEALVAQAITEGWKPCGGAAVLVVSDDPETNHYWYHQAMVREQTKLNAGEYSIPAKNAGE
jgi:hypothetical protein